MSDKYAALLGSLGLVGGARKGSSHLDDSRVPPPPRWGDRPHGLASEHVRMQRPSRSIALGARDPESEQLRKIA
jgi:hypothetical protein